MHVMEWVAIGRWMGAGIILTFANQGQISFDWKAY